LSDQSKAQRQLEELPALQWPESTGSDNSPVTVVLVIGESARSKNFSIYGYERETNPALGQHNLVVLKSAESCATYTTRSLECMLSHDPHASKLTHEILPNYLHRSGHVQVLWRSRNWGEPNLKLDSVVRGRSLSALCQPPECLEPNQDAVLLAGLEGELKNASMGKQFIVLHQSGSHGPAYSAKYPVEFSKFQPACDTVDIKKCSPESLVNAYDNTILYTDHLLDQLIGILKRQSHRRSVLIFISDHGESLGEGGWYLHGAPDIVAPKEQKEIPFFVWMSDEFIRHAKLDVSQMQMSVNQPNDMDIVNGHHQIFHSVLGALGANSSVYRSDLDIFKP
jgi:lipid A ethanolaminephosphotransferase